MAYNNIPSIIMSLNGAYQETVRCHELYVGPECLRAADVAAMRSAATTASPAISVAPPPVLVPAVPCCAASVVASERAERVQQCSELARALAETKAVVAACSGVIQLQRTAVSRGGKWFVGGKRVNVSELQSSDSGRKFVVVELTVAQALQHLMDDVDALANSKPQKE